VRERQPARLEQAIAADERHDEVWVAYQCAQTVRSVYHQKTPAAAHAIAEKVLASFTSCPIPKIARLGPTLAQWREAFLAYFSTDGANNGGTEAINGLARAAPPRRPRLPQPRQLPPAHALDRWRATPMTPHSGTKSP
jgi:transposase